MENIEQELEEIERREIGQKIKFCIICHKQLTAGRKKFCGSKICKSKDQFNKKLQEVETNPFYICQYCGYKWQLDFQPRFKEGNHLLNQIKCPECKKNRSI